MDRLKRNADPIAVVTAASPPPKKTFGASMRHFLSLKEPSTLALEQYARQQRRESQPAGVAAQKLPAHVPKVNSKWDGMPQSAAVDLPRSGSWPWSTRSQGKQPTVSSGSSSSAGRSLRTMARPQETGIPDIPGPSGSSGSSDPSATPPWSVDDVAAQLSAPSAADMDRIRATTVTQSQSMTALPEMTCFFPADNLQTPEPSASFSIATTSPPLGSEHGCVGSRPTTSAEPAKAHAHLSMDPHHLNSPDHVDPWITSAIPLEPESSTASGTADQQAVTMLPIQIAPVASRLDGLLYQAPEPTSLDGSAGSITKDEQSHDNSKGSISVDDDIHNPQTPSDPLSSKVVTIAPFLDEPIQLATLSAPREKKAKEKVKRKGGRMRILLTKG